MSGPTLDRADSGPAGSAPPADAGSAGSGSSAESGPVGSGAPTDSGPAGPLPSADALRESEARYRALVESQSEMICRFRPDGEIVFVNAAYARSRGTTPEALIGATFWDFIPDAEWEGIRAMLARLSPESPEVRIENRFETVEGVRWTLWTNRGLSFDEEGRVSVAQSTGIDITQRKRAERALKQRFRQLESIYRLSAAVSRAAEVEEIVEAALDGLIEAVNADRASVLLFDEEGVPRFAGWRGLSDGYRGAVEGHSPWRPQDTGARPITIPDAQSADGFEELRDTILGEGIRAVSFIPLVAAGGVVGKLMVYYEQPHRFAEQELHVCETIAGHVAYAIERAQAERALRESEERLREADRRKDEFLAVLGHELRNPLAPLQTMLQVLKREDADAALRAGARATMERQVEQMVRLVNDLLDVSRISRGRIRLQKRRVDLTALVRETVEDFRAASADKGHDFALELPADPVHLSGDPVRLSQVMENLLTNAWKYTGPGGRIEVVLEPEDQEVAVRVRDTGIGIEPEQLPHVFEMFSHSEEPPGGPHEGGLGIGLALVRNLVELHDGTVEGRSGGRGLGAEFVVRLPLEPSYAQPAEPEGATPAEESVSSRRILVVDDNRDAAETLALLLSMEGHEVHLVFDGREAVDRAKDLRPEVILMDIGMPKLDGYEAARLIRRQEGGRDALLLALTGWSTEADRRRSADAGFDAHLVKPLEMAELNRLLAGETVGGVASST